MDMEQLIIDYRQWVSSNPVIYKVTFGNPSETKLVPVLSILHGMLEEAFMSTSSIVLSKTANAETLDGFSAWYKYVYLSQP